MELNHEETEKNKDGRAFYMVMSILCHQHFFGVQFCIQVSGAKKDR